MTRNQQNVNVSFSKDLEKTAVGGLLLLLMRKPLGRVYNSHGLQAVSQ